ncbi:MAG: class I SAM-dependent methyltransferase [Planctomycetota bacterium]|jgi:SAM-dependent methyltransferase
MRDWPAYFDAVGEGGPRETLVEAADRFAREGVPGSLEAPLAVDLGCGSGRDTIELLRRGWRVLAVDGALDGIERLRCHPAVRAGALGERLETAVQQFDEIALPPSMLVNASYALPFCPPRFFDDLWAAIVDTLRPGGRFAGQLFGDQDDWAALDDRTHHTRAEAEALLRGFEIESFRTELHGPDPESAYPKRWHVFQIVARRR